MSGNVPNVVIWGDGGGSTFRAAADAVHKGKVAFNISGVVTADPAAGILDHVREVNALYGMDIKPFVTEGRPGRRQSTEAQEGVLKFMGQRDAKSLVLMGAGVIMGSVLVETLNGDVPEEPLPKTLEEARELMIPTDDGFHTRLPDDFPRRVYDTGQYGLSNTHPAPSIVTANTHGIGSQRRMLQLNAIESAHTYHVVATGIDTGPIIAATRFPIRSVRPNASHHEFEQAARELFLRLQEIEQMHLPMDVEMQLYRREEYLAAA